MNNTAVKSEKTGRSKDPSLQIHKSKLNHQNRVILINDHNNTCKSTTQADTTKDRWTYDISKSNNVEKSRTPARRTGTQVLIDIFIRQQRRSLAHRLWQLNELVDRLHEISQTIEQSDNPTTKPRATSGPRSRRSKQGPKPIKPKP